MNRAPLVLVAVVALSACSYSIKDVNVNGKEPACVRQCSGSYSSCVSQGPSVGFQTETLRACRDAYEVCTSTCPAQ